MKVIVASLAFAMFLQMSFSFALAQSTLDIDEKRAAELEKFSSGIPDPKQLRNTAKGTFSKPLEEQNEEILQSLAKESNRYANMVAFVTEKYDEFRRDMYRYEFVIEKVDKAKQAYDDAKNEFLGIRNQAYFNLGMKAKEKEQFMKALLLFKDAFKLSYFDCGKQQKETCIRWKAEQEIQKLLGLSSITAYVTWEKG